MARLFRGYEDAVERSLEIVERCRFSLDELRYEYPEEPVPEGQTPQQRLAELAWQGPRSGFVPSPPRKRGSRATFVDLETWITRFRGNDEQAHPGQGPRADRARAPS